MNVGNTDSTRQFTITTSNTSGTGFGHYYSDPPNTDSMNKKLRAEILRLKLNIDGMHVQQNKTHLELKNTLDNAAEITEALMKDLELKQEEQENLLEEIEFLNGKIRRLEARQELEVSFKNNR